MADSDRVHVTPATVDDVDPVTDLWIALAEGQRAHGSTLLAEENRGSVREWVARSWSPPNYSSRATAPMT